MTHARWVKEHAPSPPTPSLPTIAPCFLFASDSVVNLNEESNAASPRSTLLWITDFGPESTVVCARYQRQHRGLQEAVHLKCAVSQFHAKRLVLWEVGEYLRWM